MTIDLFNSIRGIYVGDDRHNTVGICWKLPSGIDSRGPIYKISYNLS